MRALNRPAIGLAPSRRSNLLPPRSPLLAPPPPRLRSVRPPSARETGQTAVVEERESSRSFRRALARAQRLPGQPAQSQTPSSCAHENQTPERRRCRRANTLKAPRLSTPTHHHQPTNKQKQRPVANGASFFGSNSGGDSGVGGDGGGSFDGFPPFPGSGSHFGGNNNGAPLPSLPYEAQETIFFFGADGSVSRVPGRRRVVMRPPPAETASDSGLFFLSPSAPAGARAMAGGHLPMPAASQQSICVASTFSLQATNGRDPSRRISFEGFVQLPEVLEEAVEASVLSRGGEVLVRRRDVSPEALASRLAMRVAVPLLFGVPEEWLALRETIESAGGIVHQIQRSWLIGGG